MQHLYKHRQFFFNSFLGVLSLLVMHTHELIHFATVWYDIHLIILSLNLIILVTAICFTQLNQMNNLLCTNLINRKNILLYRREHNRLLVSIHKINHIFGSVLFGCLLAYTPGNALALMILMAGNASETHFYFILSFLIIQLSFIFGVHILASKFTQLLTAKQSTLYYHYLKTIRFQAFNKRIAMSLELNRIINQKVRGITYCIGHRSIGLVSFVSFTKVIYL